MKIQTYIKVVLCAAIVASPVFGSSHIFAAENTTPITGAQSAVETVKEAINDLITAKDEKKQIEAPLRIDTLKKAVSLATDEAKNLRVKLLTLDDLTKEYKAWRNNMASSSKEMVANLEGFKKEINDLEKNQTTSDEEIKNLGNKIKEWRENIYLPFATEVQDYFFIVEENKTLDTAQNRSEKIAADIIRLEKNKKKVNDLKDLLEKADKTIEEAVSLNKDAKALFEDTYFPKPDTETIVSSTTQATIQEQVEEVVAPPKSIRDLVKDSSNKVRDSYKIFIEMSGLVRRLLK